MCECVPILNQSHSADRWMLLTLECRIAGPRNCIGRISPKPFLALSWLHANHTKVFLIWGVRILRIQHLLGSLSLLFSVDCLYSFLRYSFLYFCFPFSVVLPSRIASPVYQWVFQTAFFSWSFSSCCFSWPCFWKWAFNRKTECLTWKQPWGAWLICSTGHGDIMNCRGAKDNQVSLSRRGSPQVSWRRIQLESSRCQWRTWVWLVSDLWGCIDTLLKNFSIKALNTCGFKTGLNVLGCCSCRQSILQNTWNTVIGFILMFTIFLNGP